MSKIVAMILAGGRVGELGVLTYYRPKATLPYGGLYRIIDFPLSNLMHSGIDRIGVLSQYRSSSLNEHIGNGSSWDMVGRQRGINILPPFHGHTAFDWYRGSADAVFQNFDFIDSHAPELVCVLSGDHIYKMDYRDMLTFHNRMGADITAAFVEVPIESASRFGLANISDDDSQGGRILDYVEKPQQPNSNWASLTIYLFKTERLRQLLKENAATDSHEFGRDILPAALTRGMKVFGYKFKGYWAYSRTIEEYWQANMDLLESNPVFSLDKLGLRTNMEHEAIRDRGTAIIGKDATIENSHFYSGVRVDGKVINSILFPGVHVEKGAVVKDSILFFDTQIGPEAQVIRTITDIGVTVGKACKVGTETGNIQVLEMKSQLSQGTIIS